MKTLYRHIALSLIALGLWESAWGFTPQIFVAGTIQSFQDSELTTAFYDWFDAAKETEFILRHDTIDEFGKRHRIYRQTLNGTDIEYASVIVHSDGEKLESVTAEILTKGEQIKKSSTLKTATSTLSQDGEYCYTEVTDKKGNPIYVKAYRYTDEETLEVVYLDAGTGKILKRKSKIHPITGTGKTLYNGTQTIGLSGSAGRYTLYDTDRKIGTYNANGKDINSIRVNEPFTNATTTWDGSGDVAFLEKIQINTVSSGWFEEMFDSNPDYYIVIYDNGGNVVYTNRDSYVCDSETATFTPMQSIGVGYTLKVFDYDLVGGDDLGGTINLKNEEGTYSAKNENISVVYTISKVDKVVLAAISAHWGMMQTYDYYLNVHGRKSFNGRGSAIPQYINPSYTMGGEKVENNAFASNGKMYYFMGDGIEYRPFVSIDILAHEYSHLIFSERTVGDIVYRGEAGALNESFADIFGSCVEHFALNDQANLLIGEEIMMKSSNLRNMLYPHDSNSPQPRIYGEHGYWKSATTYDENNDYGYVHNNSGVQNRWFALLIAGETGEINGDAYDVPAIGYESAEQIAYRAVMIYLGQSPTYATSVWATLQAAKDLYGENSTEYLAVKESWKAVGLESATNATKSIDDDSETIGLKVWVMNNEMKILNQTNANVRVSDLRGALLYESSATEEEISVPLQTSHGIRIVAAGNAQRKIVW